jgi:hypothetical protein
VAGEILQVQNHRIRLHKPIFRDTTIIEVIQDMTRVFVQGIESEAKSRYESDLAKLVREQKESEARDLDNTLAGNPTGAFEEMGIIDLDSRRENGEEEKDPAYRPRASD